MAVKRYDGSAWQVVAGKGDQGTSSSIATWVKTASGGETSLSGNDDNSQPLSYTVGQELVFINGALQKRGVDYTATTGTSITGLTALVANDVVTVWTVNAFSVTGAIANTIVDNKGDILVGTGADTPGILSVGSNGQVLTADSSTGTGLAWAAPAAGKVLQVVQGTLTSQQSTTSTSYVDVGLSVAITPSSASSKVLIMSNFGVQVVTTTSQTINYGIYALLRDSTILQQGEAMGETNMAATSNNEQYARVGYMYLDSPATTSSTTYKIQFKRVSPMTVYVQAGATNIASIVAMEIGA